jgi:hypothetical protein
VSYIIVSGNPVDGLRFTGPYADHDEALEAAAVSEQEWWVAELHAPEVTPCE